MDYDFDAEELALAQQAARIKALRAMQAPEAPAQPEGFRSAVTGAQILGPAVKKPLLSSLGPLIAETAAGFQEQDMNKRQQELTARQRQGFKDWWSGRPKDTPYSAVPLNPNNPMEPGGGNLVEANVTPEQKATEEDFLNHAMAGVGTGNKLIEPYAKQVITDQLVEAPKRAQALKLETMKEANAAEQKRLDRENTIKAAIIRANASGGMSIQPSYNEKGELTGGVDSKSGKVYGVGPDGQLVLATGGGTGGVSGPAKAPSAAEQKKTEALNTKRAERDDIKGMVGDAQAFLKNTTYGITGALGEGIRKVMGKEQSESDMNAEQLDMIAGNLAAKYPRGPGTITDQERRLFVKYMGDIGNRFKSPASRAKSLNLLLKLMDDSVANAENAQAPAAAPAAGTPPADKSTKDFGGRVGTYSAKYGHYYAQNKDGKWEQLD